MTSKNEVGHDRWLFALIITLWAATAFIGAVLYNQGVGRIEDRTTCVAGILFRPPPPDPARFEHFTAERLRDECGFSDDQIDEVFPR